MRASELVFELEHIINFYGDCEIVITDKNNKIYTNINNINFLDNTEDCEINKNINEDSIIINII